MGESKKTSPLAKLMKFIRIYGNAYDPVPAHTAELREEAKRIRHEVFCDELGYEDRREQGIEEDEFDKHSLHILVYAHPLRSYVGCTRFILAQNEQGQNQPLPIEERCHGQQVISELQKLRAQGFRCAEVSRLAVIKSARNNGKVDGVKVSASQALITLYTAVYAQALASKIDYLFAIVEPRLMEQMQRVKIPAVQCGEGVNHRGLRVPIIISIKDVAPQMPLLLKPLYNRAQRRMAYFSTHPKMVRQTPYLHTLRARSALSVNTQPPASLLHH